MKEYKLNELFQWEDRTLMCVEDETCNNCILLQQDDCIGVSCSKFDRVDGKSAMFTNKLIFSAEGIKLQIKRKGFKVKVKVLELSEEFDIIESNKFKIYSTTTSTPIDNYILGINGIVGKIKHTFDTEQEAIDWVDRLFSLRGE